MNTLIPSGPWRRTLLQAGQITNLAGTGQAGYGGDGRLAAQAQFNQPCSCAYPTKKVAYSSPDALNHCVRFIDGTTGICTTVVGTGQKGLHRRRRACPKGLPERAVCAGTRQASATSTSSIA